MIIFFSNSKSKNITNDKLLKKIKNRLNFEIIDLSNVLSKEMFYDETHYNKLGHEKVADFISKKIIENIKMN